MEFGYRLKIDNGPKPYHPVVFAHEETAKLACKELTQEFTSYKPEKVQIEQISDGVCPVGGSFMRVIADNTVYVYDDMKPSQKHLERGLAKLTAEEREAIFGTQIPSKQQK